ncbi:helix-turn-helix domain-containing protein [Branchiibius sp. NY16-3462-2]|uniref:PucR family transcriptional regulator n=1 Tax=Branchiibius sp. NY16-3462-2 TaxID=1807500 RepID=UPI0007932465|nr:helix-turn-helix domain-containing protein [Branchiibius sp. NY16-3462-2]KYH45647.1 hypothetical protein AZH51_18200 [Branchiibius sp. NY16-3462-2]
MNTASTGPQPPDDERVTAAVAATAATLNARLADVVDDMRTLLATTITELDGDPALVELLRASIEGNVDTILHSLQHGIEVTRFEPPTAANEYARRLAQRGVPVNALVRAYRLGHQFLMQQTLLVVIALDDESLRGPTYARVNDAVFTYIDWISQRVVGVYEEERESWLANERNEREAVVRLLLAGQPPQLDAWERTLDYRLRGRHIAAVAWLDSENHSDQLSRSMRALKSLARAMGSTRPPLIVGHDQTTSWAWINVPSSVGTTRGWASWRLDETPAPAIALGSAHDGVEGFRRSHDEAVRMQRVALMRKRTERQVISHDETGAALAGLLSTDIESTRAWVRRVLGDLAGADEISRRHRQTLEVFLRHQSSYTATAEAMTMHKNSIKYRVSSAEKALGRSLTEDRLDLEVALTLAGLLGSSVLE